MRVCPHCSKPILRESEVLELATMRRFHSLSTAGQARLHNISLSAASNRLSKWHKLGFLKREEVVQPSGGIEYHYTHLYPDKPTRKPSKNRSDQ